MGAAWKRIFEGKSSEEIRERMGKMAKYFAENFSLNGFFDEGNENANYIIATIVITPIQVMVGVAPGVEQGTEKWINHYEEIVVPLLDEAKVEHRNFIAIHCISSQYRDRIFTGCENELSERRTITEEMNIAYNLIYDNAKRILQNDNLPKRSFEISASEDNEEQIIGIPIQRFISMMKAEMAYRENHQANRMLHNTYSNKNNKQDPPSKREEPN